MYFISVALWISATALDYRFSFNSLANTHDDKRKVNDFNFVYVYRYIYSTQNVGPSTAGRISSPSGCMTVTSSSLSMLYTWPSFGIMARFQ